MRTYELLAALALATGCTGRAYVVDDGPPPLREEVIAYRPGYVWIHGNWARDSRHWRWRSGRYEREHPNAVYVQGRWERQGGHYVWIDGGWRARVSRR